jgi:predicted Zn-dependent peptidase
MKQFLKSAVAVALLLTVAATSSWAQKSLIKDAMKYKTVSRTSADGKYTYFLVDSDPLNTRMYTLKNGLRVFMTVNKSEPRIQTNIAVRTGSNNDPKDCTGLAHYLEHMLFKGTDRYGSLDFAQEKPLLDQIEELYEKYRATKDEAKRKEIYAQIDKVSGEAAKFAIANEYDKMLSSIGAKGTNAYTSWERTVYVNDIPANMIGKWLKIESERFRNPQLRLFHTELEAVYEEKNISLDNDRRTAFFKMFETIFPTHNYGQQTTIGTVEHLKNPSIKKIKEYYAAYYVPNNMAICLSGDFDPEQVIVLIDEAFGSYQNKDVMRYQGTTEAPITAIKKINLTGPEAEFMNIGYRLPGYGNADIPALEMIDYMLSNSTAGLIDLNLVKQQRVLEAYSSLNLMTDYGVELLGGSPKEGQKLEDIEKMLLSQIDLIKAGKFDQSLVTAVVNDMEIQQMRQFESNRGRTGDYVEAFITNQEWTDVVQRIDKMRKLTKEDIVRVANKYFQNNYVVVYKRIGERENVTKVVKPQITPVEVNREAQSEFLKTLVATPAPSILPRFLDYNTDISRARLKSNVTVNYVKNEENALFTLYYLLDFGKNHDKELAFAIEYLPFLGTDKYTADDISKKFYELGTTFDVSSGDDQVYVYVSGLSKNFDASVELLEHLLKNAKADDAALASLVDRTLKSRSDAKLDKRTILWRGMQSYGMFGAKNPFNDVLSEEYLKGMKAQTLIDKIKGLTGYKHRVLYYGPAPLTEVTTSLERLHITPGTLTPVPTKMPYAYQKTDKPKVYFVNYDMVQAEILWLSSSVDYDPALYKSVRMFNEYYGGNMSSIVFQTIRESKALAYSTFSSFVTPPKSGDPFFVQAYVGTQADKLNDAVAGMNELLNGIPESQNLFENSKASIRNKIETERIIRTAILFSYESAVRHGIDRDQRKEIYDALEGLTFADVQAFHKQYVAGKQYNLLVLGSKDKIDVKALSKYGEVVELSLKDLFGY